MSVEWFEKEPGVDIAVGSEDPTMLLIGADQPDWVRLPKELGGAQRRVLAVGVGTCPRGEHDVRHFALEGDMGVAECPKHGGFLWYRRRKTG